MWTARLAHGLITIADTRAMVRVVRTFDHQTRLSERAGPRCQVTNTISLCEHTARRCESCAFRVARAQIRYKPCEKVMTAASGSCTEWVPMRLHNTTQASSFQALLSSGLGVTVVKWQRQTKADRHATFSVRATSCANNPALLMTA